MASLRPTFALIAVMLAASAVAWWWLPADVRVPIHFDIHFRADGWASKPVGLLALPATAAALLVSLDVARRFAALRNPTDSPGAPPASAATGIVGVLAMIHLAIVGELLALPVSPGRVLPFALAILLVSLGNVMGKLQRNRVMGIRTRWSLADEGIWRRTQRFTGRLFVGVGVIGGLASLFVSSSAAGLILVGGTVVASLAGAWFSWRLARRRNRGSKTS